MIAVNYTYKGKKGIVGRVYHAYMHYAVVNKYIDYLHVLSHEYVDVCCKDLEGLRSEQFIVTGFGIPDIAEEWKDCKVPMENYTLSIGRSNRDFEFLVKVWSQPELKNEQLVIISDTWQPKEPLPANVRHINNVTGAASKPWMRHCKLMVIPISDGRICSGDTVLLTGMMFSKPVAITAPSTLAEMYVEDCIDGVYFPKDVEQATIILHKLLASPSLRENIGKMARTKYLGNFTRYQMGKKIGEFLITNSKWKKKVT